MNLFVDYPPAWCSEATCI